jgi:hypothetical protein
VDIFEMKGSKKSGWIYCCGSTGGINIIKLTFEIEEFDLEE